MHASLELRSVRCSYCPLIKGKGWGNSYTQRYTNTTEKSKKTVSNLLLKIRQMTSNASKTWPMLRPTSLTTSSWVNSSPNNQSQTWSFKRTSSISANSQRIRLSATQSCSSSQRWSSFAWTTSYFTQWWTPERRGKWSRELSEYLWNVDTTSCRSESTLPCSRT